MSKYPSKMDKKKLTVHQKIDKIMNMVRDLSVESRAVRNQVECLEGNVLSKLDRLSSPSPEPDEEWEGRKSLEEGDAVECTPEQQEELKAIARAGGIKVLNDSTEYKYSGGKNLRYDKWCADGPFLIQTGAPDKASLMGPLKWLPFPVFKRLLIAEVERKKEEEAKKPLEPWTKVVRRDGVECRVLYHYPLVVGRKADLWCPKDRQVLWGVSRDEFTVL